MTPSARAWECALALSDFLDRLSPAQAVAVLCAVVAGPERAPPGMIALAAQVLGART